MDLLEIVEIRAMLAPGTLSREDVEIVAQEGDIDWVIVRLPDGRWTATDDAEVTPDRVEIFPTRGAALRFQWEGWQAAHPDYTPDQATDRFGWRAEVPRV
jgi:hypothetical protein